MGMWLCPGECRQPLDLISPCIDLPFRKPYYKLIRSNWCTEVLLSMVCYLHSKLPKMLQAASIIRIIFDNQQGPAGLGKYPYSGASRGIICILTLTLDSLLSPCQLGEFGQEQTLPQPPDLPVSLIPQRGQSLPQCTVQTLACMC